MFVGQTLCGTIAYQAGKDVYDIKCGNGVVGEYVKVVQNNNYLTLAEVQLYGAAADSVGLSGSSWAVGGSGSVGGSLSGQTGNNFG